MSLHFIGDEIAWKETGKCGAEGCRCQFYFGEPVLANTADYFDDPVWVRGVVSGHIVVREAWDSSMGADGSALRFAPSTVSGYIVHLADGKEEQFSESRLRHIFKCVEGLAFDGDKLSSVTAVLKNFSIPDDSPENDPLMPSARALAEKSWFRERFSVWTRRAPFTSSEEVNIEDRYGKISGIRIVVPAVGEPLIYCSSVPSEEIGLLKTVLILAGPLWEVPIF